MEPWVLLMVYTGDASRDGRVGVTVRDCGSHGLPCGAADTGQGHQQPGQDHEGRSVRRETAMDTTGHS